MRLPIILFAVFAVCFGLFGCTNAGDSSNDDEVRSMQPSLSENQNVLLLVTESSKVFTSQYSTKDVNISEYKIEGHSTLPESYKYVKDFTSACVDNNITIYILKNDAESEKKQTLDVIRIKENNEFERIEQVKDMFDNATSITSDYAGNIYWIEMDHSRHLYSLKFTNKSLKEPKYIIHPTPGLPQKLQVYHRKLIFSMYGFLHYTFNPPKETPNFLFSPEVRFRDIHDFTIDYITDKLCWITKGIESHLKCSVIGIWDRRINRNDIVEFGIVPQDTRTFVAFKNTFYWIKDINDKPKLYFKNGKELAVKKADLQEKSFLSIVPSICPSLVAQKKVQNNANKQNNSTNVLLLVTNSEISQFSTKDGNFTDYKIEDNSTLAESYDTLRDFTSTCLDKNIYILKYNRFNIFRNEEQNDKKMLDVIRYNKTNNKFERTNQIKDMFNDATLITSDYKTGKIYWVEYIYDKLLFSGDFSIKVTDESFKKQEYIIHPTSEIRMKRIQAYPNHKELFFSTVDALWYTSNLPNSTPEKLFSSDVTFQNILDFTIDYLTDKLCWIDYYNKESHLSCAGIDTLDLPLSASEIVEFGTVEIGRVQSLFVAFNNTFYLTASENDKPKLYFKNGNETAVKIAELPENGLTSIVTSICPSPAA